jgi:hypothetical protein
MPENHDCSCPHCETELKSGCMSPKFCKPCCVKEKSKAKVCPVCKAEYASEYDGCPSCSVSAK